MPLTWDETRALCCKAGEMAVVAKRKGDRWYIGGITGGAQRERQLDIPLSFLAGGARYRMTSFADGPNAATQAMDYRKQTARGITSADSLHLRLVRNGGFAAVLEPDPR